MNNTFGRNITLTLFGESHGKAIGCVIDGMAPGVTVDEDFIAAQMELRKGINTISTPRRESDSVKILSGVFEGKTTGTPICLAIGNGNTRSKDYTKIRYIARPGHADLTAEVKYHGYQDYRGGGHFSGRLTAPIVAAGAIAISALKKKGIHIGTHIASCHGIKDRGFENYIEDVKYLATSDMPVLSDSAREAIITEIENAKAEGDSVGGTLETLVLGVPAGLGEPWFDSMESMLSHAMFSIPAVKGIEFGAGFGFASMYGSEANDPYRCIKDTIINTTNNNGGINGGITNGLPLQFTLCIKPTPSIYKKQKSVNFKEGKNIEFQIEGRHDPAIIHRAKVVVDSLTALVLCDLLTGRYGTDCLGETK